MSEHTFELLLFMGCVVLIRSLYHIWQARMSRDWPSVQGELLPGPGEVDFTRDSPAPFIQVTYRYNVGGKEFVGRETQFGDISLVWWLGLGELTLNRYEPGAAVVVHHHPEFPSEAVLEPGVHLSAILSLVAALVFVAVVSWFRFASK